MRHPSHPWMPGFTVVSLAGLLFGVAACNNHSLVGENPNGVQTDNFISSQTVGPADILFVINETDASVNQKSIKLGNSAVGFINYLTTKSIDFHIAVTSMDMNNACGSPVGVASTGCFNGSPKIIDSSTPNLLATFQKNLLVGSNGQNVGASKEYGIDAALAAVSTPNTTGANAGFLRPGAKLFVVFLTDEDDCANTPGTINNSTCAGPGAGFDATPYVTAFAAVKGGNKANVILSAIAGDTPGGCGGGSGSSSDPNSTGADPAYEYNALIQASGGLFESACNATPVGAEYTTFLDNLGFAVGAATTSYTLSEPPSNPSGITVTVNGVVVPPADYSYDGSNNSVAFNPPLPASACTQVDITYAVSATTPTTPPAETEQCGVNGALDSNSLDGGMLTCAVGSLGRSRGIFTALLIMAAAGVVVQLRRRQGA